MGAKIKVLNATNFEVKPVMNQSNEGLITIATKGDINGDSKEDFTNIVTSPINPLKGLKMVFYFINKCSNKNNFLFGKKKKKKKKKILFYFFIFFYFF